MSSLKHYAYLSLLAGLIYAGCASLRPEPAPDALVVSEPLDLAKLADEIDPGHVETLSERLPEQFKEGFGPLTMAFTFAGLGLIDEGPATVLLPTVLLEQKIVRDLEETQKTSLPGKKWKHPSYKELENKRKPEEPSSDPATLPTLALFYSELTKFDVTTHSLVGSQNNIGKTLTTMLSAVTSPISQERLDVYLYLYEIPFQADALLLHTAAAALRTSPDDYLPVVLNALADRYRRNGDYRMERLLQVEATRRQASISSRDWLRLASTHFRNFDSTSGDLAMDAAAEAHDRELYRLAQTLATTRQHEFQKAKNEVSRIRKASLTLSRLVPSNELHVELNKVSLLRKMGRHEDALARSRELTEEYPNIAQPWIAVGDLLYEEGRHTDAAKAYLSAFRKNNQEKDVARKAAFSWLHLWYRSILVDVPYMNSAPPAFDEFISILETLRLQEPTIASEVELTLNVARSCYTGHKANQKAMLGLAGHLLSKTPASENAAMLVSSIAMLTPPQPETFDLVLQAQKLVLKNGGDYSRLPYQAHISLIVDGNSYSSLDELLTSLRSAARKGDVVDLLGDTLALAAYQGVGDVGFLTAERQYIRALQGKKELRLANNLIVVIGEQGRFEDAYKLLNNINASRPDKVFELNKTVLQVKLGKANIARLHALAQDIESPPMIRALALQWYVQFALYRGEAIIKGVPRELSTYSPRLSVDRGKILKKSCTSTWTLSDPLNTPFQVHVESDLWLTLQPGVTWSNALKLLN